MVFFCYFSCKMCEIALPLHCVFHSIRFKVNKIGVQRYPFFLCLIRRTFGIALLFYPNFSPSEDVDAGRETERRKITYRRTMTDYLPLKIIHGE